MTQRIHLCCTDDDLPAQGALVARQEGLAELSLTVPEVGDDDGAADTGEAENLLIRALLLGGATCQRLHILRISADCHLTAAGGHAVRLCCPSLRELYLEVAEFEDDAFIRPLHTNQSLSKVSVAAFTPDGTLQLHCGPAVRALSHLASLRTVVLRGFLDATELAPLSALTGLRHLDLSHLIIEAMEEPSGAEGVGRVLGRLTQLSHLETPLWGSEDAAAATATLDAVLAPLGTLRCLSSLTIGSSSAVRAAGMAALCQMTALTHLCGPPIAHHMAFGSGHLPGLRRLKVTGRQSGADLAVSLRPFLPLPALQEVIAELRLGAVGGGALDDGGHTAAEAFHFATLLLAAPHLQQIDLTLDCREFPKAPLSAAEAAVGAAALLPLLGRLTRLTLVGLPAGGLEALWPVLCGANCLNFMSIRMCHVPASGLLMLVGQHLPALRTLHVLGCFNTRGTVAVALGQVRVPPLSVMWRPILDEDEVAFCAVAKPGVTLNA